MESRRGVSAWLRELDHYATFVAISGLVFFVVLSVLYDQFYRAFGLSAPSMGIGYLDTLIRSWGFIVCTVALCAVTTPAIFYVSYRRKGWPRKPMLPWPYTPSSARFKRGSRAKIEQSRRKWLIVSSATIVVYILTGGLILGFQAVHENAAEAKRGIAVEPIRIAGMLFLDVYAHRVDRIAAVPDSSPASVPTGQMMYLGNADRSYVLYNVQTGQTIRLSTERFVVTTYP